MTIKKVIGEPRTCVLCPHKDECDAEVQAAIYCPYMFLGPNWKTPVPNIQANTIKEE